MRKWLPLAAICTGTFMLLVDVTIVNVALPDLAADLGTSSSQLQWVVDVYALALAALVLGAGSLADLFGRRRLYLGGLGLFAVASLACGLAPSADLLVAARAVQGVGGAAMLATTIALINTSYEGRDRGTAFGVWGAVVGAAAALGPILGGALSELSWRWIFFVNLPVTVLAVALTLIAVEESRRDGAPRPDVPGIVLFSLGIGGVVYGLVEAGGGSWGDALVWGPIAAGLVVLAAWVLVERRVAAPMLDVSLFAERSFTGIMLGALLLNAAAFSSSLYTSLWLQSILGLSPLQGGLVFVPLSLVSFVVAGAAGRFLQTLSPRLVLGGGLVVVGAGSLLLALVGPGSSWPVLLPGLAVLGLGVGIANPTLASAALATVPRERSGMASGAVNTFRQLGFALGVAVLSTVFTARAASSLADAGTPDASGSAAGLVAGQAGRIIGSAPAEARAGLTDALAAAYAEGLRSVFLVCGLGGVLGGVLVLLLVRAAAPGQEPEPERAAADGAREPAARS
ncbi:DHA2 family efflux MFS transporter permease subunit [Modestobacter sp. I12A-02628]|uniref:MFS transporter n=1 Tax=Goekera deserti TaxID=2497753 RepID=A0A7K3WB41_9ACTN|nr:MFS transporter [Goekera deserti]MPQ97570.1 DHA2 family efflux MFS transporter permease subunit [Goekera deserti]NDI47826.1 DHA2 family efflux MFS transporter permease subunit [Goekera deserti]NEL53574.1 MFS transporter [Goekera deserti]